MDKGKKPMQEADQLPLGELRGSANEIASNSSDSYLDDDSWLMEYFLRNVNQNQSTGYQNLLSNGTTIGSSSSTTQGSDPPILNSTTIGSSCFQDLHLRAFRPNQLISGENQVPDNTSIDGRSLQALHFNENQLTGFQDLSTNTDIGASFMQGSHLPTLTDLSNNTGGSFLLDSGACNPISIQNQQLGRENFLSSNTVLDGGFSQRPYLHNPSQSLETGYDQNLHFNNTSSLPVSQMHEFSQSQQASYGKLLSDNTSISPPNLSANQQIHNQNLLPITGAGSLLPNLENLNGNQQVGGRNLLQKNSSISESSSSNSLLQVQNQNITTTGVSGNQQDGSQNLILRNTNSIDSRFWSDPGMTSNFPNKRKAADSTFINGSSFQAFNPAILTQNQSNDGGTLLSNNTSKESGVAGWGSTTGTSYLNELDDNDAFLSMFSNINHVNPSVSDLSAPTELERQTTGMPPPVLPPASSFPRSQQITGDLSSLMREITPSNTLQELAERDPKRARRILTNQKAANKANDRTKQYLSELDRRIKVLQEQLEAYKSEMAQLVKNEDVLHSEHSTLQRRLDFIVGEINRQEKMNEQMAKDIANLKEVVVLPSNSGSIMNNIKRSAQNGNELSPGLNSGTTVPALTQQSQVAANNSAQPSNIFIRLMQQFQQQQVEPPKQQLPHYQAPEQMEIPGTTQLLPQLQVQALNQLQQFPRANAGSNITNSQSQQYQIQQFPRQQPLPQLHLAQPLAPSQYQRGQQQQQQNAPLVTAMPSSVQQVTNTYRQNGQPQPRNSNSMHFQQQN